MLTDEEKLGVGLRGGERRSHLTFLGVQIC